MARILGACAILFVALSPAVARADYSAQVDGWSWMERYPVWEPNRQVFLYPENWLLQPEPDSCSGDVCRFTFSLAGQLSGIGSDSALASYVHDGQRFSAEGHFYQDGTLEFTALRIVPDPGGIGWQGDYVATPELDANANPVTIEHIEIAHEGWEPDDTGGGTPDPGLCRDQPCFTIKVQPRLLLRSGPLGGTYLSPSIRFVFADPSGTLSLSNLREHLSQLRSVEVSSLSVTVGAHSEPWQATVTSMQLVTAPRYGRELFHSGFDLDAIGAAPSAAPLGPPAADGITLWNGSSGGNSILVQGPSASFPANSLRVAKAAGAGNSPIFEAHLDPAFGPYTSGRYRVSWRSLAEAAQHYGFAAVVAPGNYAAFTVNYSLAGVLDFRDGTGVVHTGVPYSPGVAQQLEALIDLDVRTFDLWVDGVRVGSARPFQHHGFTSVDRFLWEIGGVDAEAYAITDLAVSCFTFSDVTPPVTTVSLWPPANALGWNRAPVTAAISAKDGCAGSGVKDLHFAAGGTETVVSGATASLELVADGETTLSAYAIDKVGNQGVAQSATTIVRIDRTPPTVAFNGSCPARPTLKSWTTLQVAVADDISGIASQSVPNGPYQLDTSTVGMKTFAVTASDRADNTSADACTYRVIYDFLGAGGFAAPVKALPAVNTVKAGSAVPVKWQLPDGSGGYVGDAGTVAFIRLQEAACQGFGALENALPVDASASGASGLRYDTAASQFVYTWKTSSAMAGRCYVLMLGLDDGSSYSANFSVK